MSYPTIAITLEQNAETGERLVARVKRAVAQIPGGCFEAETEELSRSRGDTSGLEMRHGRTPGCVLNCSPRGRSAE